MGLLKFFRGSVWWYEFTDQCNDTRVTLGKRPCVIISDNKINVKRGIVSVLPITSNLTCGDDGCKVIIPSVKGDKEGSAVMCNQIRTVDIRDLYEFSGIVPENYMLNIENRLKSFLGFGEVKEIDEVDGEEEHEEKDIELQEVKTEDENKKEIEILHPKKEKWSSEQKRQFLLDYETMEVNELIEKYALSSIKSARNKAYECRKSVGTTKKYKKMAFKAKKAV